MGVSLLFTPVIHTETAPPFPAECVHVTDVEALRSSTDHLHLQ